MNIKNFTLYTFLLTTFSFVISCSISSTTDSEKSYPQNIFDKYSIESGNTVEINKETMIDSNDLSAISIKLVDTDVELYQSDDNQIKIELKGNYSPQVEIKTEINGHEISVELVNLDMVRKNNFFNLNYRSEDGKMKIGIPKNIISLTMKSVSADIEIKDINLENINLRTVSGDVELKGHFEKIDIVSVSGDIEIKNTNISPQVSAKTTSGDIEAIFKNEPDIILNFKSLSGDIRLEHNGKKTNTISLDDGKGQIGNGTGKGSLNVSSISGDLKIKIE